MAGPDVTEEFVAIDGIVATGAFGAAIAPSTAKGALGGTWTDQGLTTDAGVTRSQPVTSTQRRAWQQRRKLRTIVTEAAVRFQFVLVQTTQAGIQLWHGMPLVAGSIVTDPGREWPLIAFDIDMIDSDSTNDDTIREYAPSARVVEVGDQVALSGDGWGWPITIEAEYDSTLGGYTKQFFSKFETPAVATIATALPASMGAGGIVRLTGTGFSTTTAVTVGGVPVLPGDIDVFSPVEMYITLPAGAAGSAPIIVTNAGGASTPKAYTRTT